MYDEKTLREVYDAIHAPEETFREVLKMTVENPKKNRAGRLGGRMAAAMAAAVLLFSGFVAAATGAYRLQRREAEQGERFRLNFVTDRELYWENAKLVFEFEPMDSCQAVRFLPGWLPREPGAPLQLGSAEEGYTRLTGEWSDGTDSGQPYLIETYYAPQFSNGGHLIMLYYSPEEIIDETWGEYQIMKFNAGQDLPANDYAPARHLERSYYIMFHQTDGYLLVISGEGTDIATLEKIGQSLTVIPTQETVSSADYKDYNVFMDGGMG